MAPPKKAAPKRSQALADGLDELVGILGRPGQWVLVDGVRVRRWEVIGKAIKRLAPLCVEHVRAQREAAK